MNELVKYLTDAKVFYLATIDGDQPRVRPMGLIFEYQGKAYFGTNNTKDMYRQMKANPKIEICAMAPDGSWLRVYGKVSFDASAAAQTKALEASPNLKSMYSVGDGKFTLFYFESGAVGSISDFSGGKKEIKI